MYLYWLDILGTFVFAITGGFRAIKYELDILGVMVLSTAVGVGGGMMRDILIGVTPPFALRNHDYLLTCCIAGACVFFFARNIAPSWRVILYTDAVGLAVFTAVGAQKASTAGLGLVGVLFIATIASVGGSIIRDVLTGEIPYIFTRDIYASAALGGGFAFWACQSLNFDNRISFISAFVVVIVLRFIALKWNLNLPKSRKLPLSPSEMVKRKESST